MTKVTKTTTIRVTAKADRSEATMISVVRASTSEQLDDVRELMRAFVEWHRRRNAADRSLVNGYFDAAAFEDELASLPGEYAPPTGCLLVATSDGGAAGCVALRGLGNGVCEMKRMFVRTNLHGRGVGRALATSVIDAARSLGFERMRLDTSAGQVEAIGLYESEGFVLIEPYYELPDHLREWLVFMELRL
jgi:putative acetyltransferase